MPFLTISDAAIEKIVKDHEYKVMSGKVKTDLIIENNHFGDCIYYPFLGFYRIITKIENVEKHEIRPIINSIDDDTAKSFTKLTPKHGVTIVVYDATLEAFDRDANILIDYRNEFYFLVQ